MNQTSELVYYNTDAEQSLLGEILLDPSQLDKVQLRPHHFYHRANNIIFHYMQEVVKAKEELTMMTLADKMMGEVQNVGGIEYITSLVGTAFGKSVLSLERILTNLYIRRESVKLNRKMEKEITEGIEPLVAANNFTKGFEKLQAENDLYDEDDGHISKVLARIASNAEEDKGEVPGGVTGFKDLDKVLNGLKPKSLTIVGARPSMGKTALAVNIGQNYALKYVESEGKVGGPVLIFSIEMDEEQLGERMISSDGHIDGYAMSNPARNFKEEQWVKMYNSMGHLSNAPIHIFDQAHVDMNYIKRKSRMVAEKYPGEEIYIIIDYLQLIKGDERLRGNENLMLGEIAKGLKELAKELGANVITLSQLSRESEKRNDKRPMNSDLNGSGGIEAAADVIMLLYRDDYYERESENKGIMEVIIGKNRNGSVGTVNLLFKKEMSKFINIG